MEYGIQTRVVNPEDTSIIFIADHHLLGNENSIFEHLVQKSIDQGSKNISVDLSRVKFISSWRIEGFLNT